MNYLIEVEATAKSAVGPRRLTTTTYTVVENVKLTGESLIKQVSQYVESVILRDSFMKEPEILTLNVVLRKQSEGKVSQKDTRD